jgi:hypothetical protein
VRIATKEIDAEIAEAAIARLAVPRHELLRDDIYWGGLLPIKFNWQFHSGGLSIKRKREPTADERAVYDLRKKIESTIGGYGAGAATAIFSAVMCAVIGNAIGWLIAVPSAIAGIVCLYRCHRLVPRVRLHREMAIEEMRAVFPLLSLTRCERIYCDTVLMVARAAPDVEREAAMRATLRQMGELLATSRDLENRRQSLLSVMGSHSIPALEAEAQALAGRLAAERDSVQRRAIEQSIAMCTSRLENARAFEQGLDRLSAQEEAIAQTMASALSALARVQLGPAGETDAAAQQVQETISTMNRQSQAVEQAVLEIMTLRSE